nr:reverse transcriptase domain-containing protein [Tanacetum cinerariifolium]
MKQNRVSDDALHLSLFPYSLTHHATAWYDRLPRNSIHTFDDMMRKFLSKYFPPSMVTKLRNKIKDFRQKPNESLFGACERYKLSIDRWHNHNMLLVTQIDKFYNDLKLRHRDTINVAAGGTFMQKTLEECYDLIENMTALLNHWDTLATRHETSRGISSTTTTKSPEVIRQLDMLNKNFQEMMKQIPPKKLPKKLEDPGRFLIPCDFQGLESCMALADLGASINLIPLSVWKKLSLPDLTSTRMTLELATRSFAYPAGIAEDVFVQVGKFTFPADFVFVDYDVDPRVPLILGRPFLRMARALVDVHGEEVILRDGDEQLIFHADSTSKHPHKHGNESINMINFIDITCEDRFPKVLKFKKSNHPSSGSTTPFSDSSPSLTSFENSDSLLEEFADELALLDPIPPEKKDNNIDFEVDLIHRRTFSRLLISMRDDDDDDDDDDDIFDPKSDNDEWKKLLYGDCYKDIDSKKDKNKDSKMKLLVVEAHIFESNNLLLDNDSTLPEESSESSEIASLSSSPFGNKDKVFNPGIHILGRTYILNDESNDKDLILDDRKFLSISSDQELMFFLELTVIETLLSFSFENKDKVFNPRILFQMEFIFHSKIISSNL